MATIDLTLDALKIPALENYTPDFGKKITKTAANKGGLSTSEVNSNIMLPWAYMRPKVVTEASTTSLVEYDAKVNFAAALQAGVTLTMGNGDYEGCEVSLRNLSAYSCTVEHGSFSLAIPAGGFVRIIWNGTTWTPDVSATVGSGILPPTSTAVQAAIESLVIAKLPYSFNSSQNISNFNKKFVYDGSPVTATMQHTGRLTLRCIKNGDGYSLYLRNQNNVLLDVHDNFKGSDQQTTDVTNFSITLMAWVKKGDVITLSSNLPSSSSWENTFFLQTGVLSYNSNYD